MKQTKIKKICKIFLILALVNLVSAGVAFASQQQTNLTVNASYNLTAPASLTLPPTFIDRKNDTIIYYPYDPSNIAEKITVTDLRNSGGFTVDFRATDLVSSKGEIIPYSNLAIVTLSDDPTGHSIDSKALNSPTLTDAASIFSPIDCDWNKVTSFYQACDIKLEQHILTGTSPISSPQTIINGATPTSTGRIGQYSVSLGIRLSASADIKAGDYTSTFIFTFNPSS